jgi:putative ABC transport system ATP-binding protein
MANRLDALLQQAIAAFQAGDRRQAWHLLTRVVRQDPDNELGWLWLSALYTEPEQVAFCLRKVLAINPDNAAAQDGLARLEIAPLPGAPFEETPSIDTDQAVAALAEATFEPTEEAPPPLRPELHLVETSSGAQVRRPEPGLAPIVRTQNLHRVFQVGREEVHAVNGVNLDIAPHQVAVVKGRSGSGKTTLLNLIAGLDEPTRGQVFVEGEALSTMAEAQRIDLRRKQIGFVFQAFGLLPMLSAQENVEVPMRIVGRSRKERELRSAELLEMVGMTPRAKHRPYELSGGEQQRVAIARALANHPSILLADEPTGQLDSTTGKEITRLLRDIMEHQGVTVLIATHDPAVMESADTIYELSDGQLVSESRAGSG